MSASLAFDLASLADTVTKTVIAFLTLIAVMVVVLGLGRAFAGRRRAQIVIEDVVSLLGVPESDLSHQLRQGVRHELAIQSQSASHSHRATLERDVAARLLVMERSTMVREVTDELQASARDSLAALTAGVRALAPQQADGLLAVLGVCLPAQRGCVVRAYPASRESGGVRDVGLTLEFGAWGRAPEAVTTFWATAATAAVDGKPSGGASRTMHDLLEPASVWIAIRLVAQYLGQTGRRDGRWLGLRGRRRVELAGLRLQLAGQLSLYAIRQQGEFGVGFAKQALEDLAEAARQLPDYFRPHYMQALVQERVGGSDLRAGRTESANQAFLAAIKAYSEAEMLLPVNAEPDSAAASEKAEPPRRESTDPKTAEAVKEHLVEIANRRRTCRLLSGDDGEIKDALGELRKWNEPIPATWSALFNAACLFAVAAGAIADDEVEQASQWKSRAWHLLGRSLLVGGAEAPWNQSLTDIQLQNLDRDQRRTFRDKLKALSPDLTKRDDPDAQGLVNKIMRELGLPLPPRMTPVDADLLAEATPTQGR